MNNYCYSCYSCNYCNYCYSCYSCYSCYYCYSCYSCNSCNYCNYCYSCNSCYSCYYCKNLKMTEHNIFCYSRNYNDEYSFQQKRYRAFNKEVGEDRYYKIKGEVADILDSPNLQLTDFWKQVTQEQWNKLLSIPEAKDFKEGFEYISGVKIDDDMVTITVEGKSKRISRVSARELNLL